MRSLLRICLLVAATTSTVSLAASVWADANLVHAFVHIVDTQRTISALVATAGLVGVGLLPLHRFGNNLAAVGVGLLWGGAVANSVEAVVRGGVLDYIPYPLAAGWQLSLGDVALGCGMLLVALSGLSSLRRPPPAAELDDHSVGLGGVAARGPDFDEPMIGLALPH